MKTPANVADAIKKLGASDQVAIQTYIAKLKASIEDLEAQVMQLREDDPHAHYHGHEKCTSDHGHSHDHGTAEKEAPACGGDHSCDGGHSHEHKHGHSHAHGHKTDDDVPAWKKKAMDADPNAAPFGGTWDAEASVDATADKEDYPPMYEGDGSNDDFDTATDAKMAASDLKSSGDYAGALEKFTKLYWRLILHPCCSPINPDSAKALRIRGECKLKTNQYHAALKDLSAAQSIDFDEEAAAMLKEATEKCKELDAIKVQKKVEEEEKLRKRSAEIKKAQEDARKEAEEEARERSAAAGAGAAGGGFGGMPGGMGGMEGMMAGLMSDPEIAAGLQNPKVMAAFQELLSGPGGPMGLLSNPGKLQEMMADPEVGPVLQKMMGKMMGGMGGGGMSGMGMPGGFGGAGGRGGGFGDDDMPDIGGDDDDDEMPDLVD
eukprot:g13378.t1 g13378   contig8:552119-554295(+)